MNRPKNIDDKNDIHPNISSQVELLKTRYADLKAKADGRAQALEEALPLAEKVKDTHEKFHELLQHIEPELRSKEPVGPEAEEQVQVGLSCSVSLLKY